MQDKLNIYREHVDDGKSLSHISENYDNFWKSVHEIELDSKYQVLIFPNIDCRKKHIKVCNETIHMSHI